MSALRTIAEPFVVAPPAGARVRTRLRVPDADAAVLREAGEHLGSLASADLAARCAEGRLDAKGRAESRRARKQALTAESSSRWAGALTRTSENAYQLAYRNLRAERHSLLARIKRIQTRSAVPAGTRAGYSTRAGRHSKTVRVQALRTRLTKVGQQLQTGRVSVCRGGKTLLHKRDNLGAAGLTEAQWREQWTASRLFLTADGEKDKTWGNETIRWNPDQNWLEIRLPTPLLHLANRPNGRYRLSCRVEFTYRGGDVAAQAATGAVRYDISLDPARSRWYLDASWKTRAIEPVTLDQARMGNVISVDLNAGHLAVAVAGPGRQPDRRPPHHRPPAGRASRSYQRRAPPGRDQPHPPHCPRAPRDRRRDREPGLRRRPPPRPRTHRKPAIRTPRTCLPTSGNRHPHRQIPEPAHPHGLQRRHSRHRRGPGLHLPLGSAALAHPHAATPPQAHRPPRGSNRDRETRTRPPGSPACVREPIRTRGCDQVNPGTPRD